MQQNYIFRVMAFVMTFLFWGNLAFSQVSITSSSGSLYSQDFNGLTTSTTASAWSNNITIGGWYLFTKDANPIATYVGGTGSSNAGSFYSFGGSSVAERALGGAASAGAYFGSPVSGAIAGWIAASFTNNSGVTINNLNVAFNGEQWRNGGNTTAQTMVLEYGFGTTFAGVTNWIVPGANFDWTSVVNTTTGAAVDGNVAGLVNGKGGVLTSLGWTDGTTLWIRWVEKNDAGSDHGLAIDDFSLSVPVITPTLSIANTAIIEGNAGTSILTFTATLSAPAPIGGVTFDIATANLATPSALAGTDYVANSITGLTIAEGANTAIFEVTINGDTDSESDETFEVNISNISSNATIFDGQAIGTINNDDATPLALSINDVSIIEGNAGSTNATFTVTLSATAATDVTFEYTTANGTATETSDYTLTSGSASITAGNLTATITVPVLGDTDFEPNEIFTINLTNATNAAFADAQGQGTIINDDLAPAILISAVQGSGLTAAILGNQTVRGIVTRTFLGATVLNGFYMQEEDADADANPATSEGIFVQNPPTLPSVGDLVTVNGIVSEIVSGASSLTAFSTTSSVTIISSGNILPAVTNVTLPIANVPDFERFEGMLVNVSASTGDLLVTENFELGRYGQVVLAANDPSTNQPDTDARIDQYTQFNAPSVSGYAAYLTAVAKRTIYLDDAKSGSNPDPLFFGRGGMPLTATNTLRTGDALNNVTGILDHRFEGYRIQTADPVNFTAANPRPTSNPDVGAATLKVGHMNVLNFFNGDGAGGGFPTSRGADTSEEFARQRNKILQAIKNTGADIMSLNEIENDGYGAESAIQDLINGLNGIQGAGTWAFITPSAALSTDAITVGMIYKPAKVTPKGASKVYFGGEFNVTGRGALAQTFEQVSNGADFTAVSVHFKSKGSASAGTGNTDSGDGQAQSNGTRTRQSENLRDWLINPATGINDPDVIILGDLNSYAKEDPIITLETAGYLTLIPINKYSYQFDGNFGALDHALGSASIASQMTGALKWNINSDEPIILDYNTEFKSIGQVNSFYAGDEYRSSDHDPVVVGLDLQCEKPTASIVSDPISGTACEGETITLIGSGGTLYSWNGATFGATNTFAVTANGSNTVKLIVKDSFGCESVEVEKTVTIIQKPAEVVTTATICSGATYTWSVNSSEYSTNTTVVIVNNGCTANQKLVLTVTPLTYAIATTAKVKYLNNYLLDADCNIIAKVIPGSITGNIDANVIIGATNITDGSAIYGPRKYTITPENNGTAVVTLYFTQLDFDTYNADITKKDLPIDATDMGGNKSNLLIFKKSGTETVVIDPNDTDILFADDHWAVSFEVPSFSEFFFGSAVETALPVNLVSFSGKKQGNINLLEWKTTNEKAFEGFEVQKSVNSKAFEKIGFIKGSKAENYKFEDKNINQVAIYYRLKMIDLDGSSTLSKIVVINSDNKSNTLVGKVYPNPAVDKKAFVEITTERAGTWKVTTFNTLGAFQNSTEIQIQKGLNKVSIEMTNLSQGIYFLNLENAEGEKFVRKVLKN